jgi:hypothetical protein
MEMEYELHLEGIMFNNYIYLMMFQN